MPNSFDKRIYCGSCYCYPCTCYCGPRTTRQFLSCYVEALGNTQTVNAGRSVIFNLSPELIDIVGTGISVTNDNIGTLFTINRKGLYSIEWSLNLASGDDPRLIGLLENGSPTSALSNTSVVGNYSSGGLINVTTVPFNIRLFNFGATMSIENPGNIENTAASIRILRFADGPSI